MLDLDARPAEQGRRHLKSRAAPSAWLEEVRNFIGQYGQVSSLFSFLGGLGKDLELRHGDGALPERVPMQSEPVSPPPITTTCFPVGEDRLLVALRLAGDRRFCCGR